jgi:protein transport protein SEC23
MCTPLSQQGTDLPLLPYDPLLCTRCGAVLNPYARLDYQSRIWHCPFCSQRNPFPRSIADANLPAELFPTYTTVEYSSPSIFHPPGFVFVIDVSTPEDELCSLKNEILLVLHNLPDNALVALVTFDSMVYLHDLQFSHGSRIVLLHGHRQFSSDQVPPSITFLIHSHSLLYCILYDYY